VIVISLFPNEGKVPTTMPEVWDRIIELQFANKTNKDVELARSINALLTVLMELQGLQPGDPNPALEHAGLAQLANYSIRKHNSDLEFGRRGRLRLVRLLAREHRAAYGNQVRRCKDQPHGTPKERKRDPQRGHLGVRELRGRFGARLSATTARSA